MPLRQSSARKRRTQGLRQRMRTLTRYEPENASTDDENDSDRPVGVTLPHGHHHRQSHSHKSVAQQATEQSVLKKVDVEILRIIAGLADQRAHTRTRARIEQQRQNDYSGRYNYNGKEKEEDDDLDFVDAFQAFEAFTELNNLTRNNYRNFFTVLNILINLCGQAPLPQERDTWSTRLSAYLQTYSAAELRRANNTLLRARLHSFDNRTRDRFLGLWYESYSAQTERDKKLGEIAAQYNWCRVVAAPLQLWFTRLTEQRAREAAAGAKADLRLKRRMFDRLLARCQAVTVAEEKADRLTKGLAEEVLTGWINRTKRIVQMDNQAAEEDRAILINDVFQQWARSFDIVDDMYAHAELASDTLATRLADKYLNLWFGRYVDVEELETTGDELAAEREMAMKREALVVWAERARTVAENAREADRQVAARALVRWHESHERVAQLETDADDFVLASNLQLVERTYRAWRMRMFKVRTKARDADDFNKQLGEQRFKAVWRYWKLRTWELQNERALMPTMSQRQPQKQQHPPAANFLQQRESVMRSYSILRRPLVNATATNPRPVPQLVAFTAPEPALAPAEPPDQAETPAGPATDEEYAPETPTRPHVRKTVPYTSLGRWRRARTPAGRLLGTGGGGGGGAATIPRFEPASQFPITQSNAAAAAATAMSPSYGR
ncbi:hypothetical protein DV451_002751 [Geotrichum candidum]|uniref:Sfi1 spindle body domain-containing protein n=1 Tax=Geotrichum candidum TaxID=1173061 RepID=A0A9P5G541_GEOCN|nr:hypothetical protein DV451_002751 [Geotrichum candidum]KAF5106311.1 hypothetical protein DV453_004032 [Geotrichum candidum]